MYTYKVKSNSQRRRRSYSSPKRRKSYSSPLRKRPNSFSLKKPSLRKKFYLIF